MFPGYENTWQEVLKERKRRNCRQSDHILKQPRLKSHNLGLDHNNQLQILTEIKKSVNENNNLIKKRLDSSENENLEGDSIHTLAERNISELNRLSKMADRSVKMITRQDTRKRDLNPGFDSENIQKPVQKIEKPFQNYPHINIPNISKIISLKSQDQTTSQSVTTQATSMDEPQNSAAGQEIFGSKEKTKDFGCQVDEPMQWSMMEVIFRNYREYEAGKQGYYNSSQFNFPDQEDNDPVFSHFQHVKKRSTTSTAATLHSAWMARTSHVPRRVTLTARAPFSLSGRSSALKRLTYGNP